MSAPFSRYLADSIDPQYMGTARAIDNHYHLQMIAKKDDHIADYLADGFAQAHEDAMDTLARLDEQITLQEETNSLLFAIGGGINRLNSTAQQILQAQLQQTEVLRSGFREIAVIMIQQKQVLDQIADTLSRPLETVALERLRNALDALQNGRQSTGRERDDWYKDAMDLLNDIRNDSVGKLNYIAWFETGWLHWKKGNYVDAEKEFYHAARLSQPKADLYHAYSLRHEAYMQYHLGRHKDAYSTIHRALQVTENDYDILYDAARYAVKVGRPKEALQHINKCIDMRPQTFITVLTEPDFIL